MKTVNLQKLFWKVCRDCDVFIPIKQIIPKPQKIADSNFLGFKNWQQLKSAFFWGPRYTLKIEDFGEKADEEIKA
ncbi:MAG: hypothetical protein LBS83_00350 [Holosporales bacterium]|jgi:hypothetical protein|nr:hypothetical protein [Holosporales bacterium]